MWFMMTDMKHTTVPKCSFFKLFAKFADLSKSFLSPGTEIGQQGSKIGEKKTKKPPILFTFRKVVFFLAVSPKDGAGGRGERLGVLQRRVGRGSSKEGMAL